MASVTVVHPRGETTRSVSTLADLNAYVINRNWSLQAGNYADAYATVTGQTYTPAADSQGPAVVGIVRPSGDTTGGTDLAAINAARACVLQPGATYYVNGPIVRGSRSRLDATGATIRLVVGGTNILRNTAVAPTRTVLDGACTTFSSTVTSATAAFTGADVGSKVGLVGAAYGQATWYGKVTAVAGNGLSATLDVTSDDRNVTGARLDVFTGRDTDITIEGGTWICDVAPLDGHNPAATAFNSFAAVFRRVDGLRIRNTRWQTAGVQGQGGKFTVSLADVDDFLVEGTHFINTSGDGVHVTGPGSNGTVAHTSGTTGDDMVVFNPCDSNTPYITDTEGPLSHLSATDIKPTNSLSGFKLYDIGLPKKFTCTGIHVHDISGSTVDHTVCVINAVVDDLLISSVSAAPGVNKPLVDLQPSQYSSQITCRDLTWISANPATSGVVQINQGRNIVKIENVLFATAPAGTNLVAHLYGGTSGAAFGLTVLDVDGVYTPMQIAGVQVTAFVLNIVNWTGTGTGDSTVRVRGLHVTTTGGYVFKKTAVSPTGRVEIADSVFVGTALATTPAGDSRTALSVTGVRARCTNLVQVQSPMDLYLANVNSECSGAAVALTAAGATPVRALVGSYLETGTGGGVTRTATQAVSVRGLGLPVDVSILTPADGDLAFNSNAALGCGTGPVVYSAAAAKWKGLYSGLTN